MLHKLKKLEDKSTNLVFGVTQIKSQTFMQRVKIQESKYENNSTQFSSFIWVFANNKKS
jgi:hypothetical protein